NCVMLGKTSFGVDRYCNRAGASLTREQLILLFNLIKEDVVAPVPIAAAVADPSLAGRVQEILKAQVDLVATSSYGYYVSPNIPARKLSGATKGCSVPADEKVLALVDCTVFGSAGDALVFGQRG